MSDTAQRQHAIDTIDAATLTPLVRLSLRDRQCEVIEWAARPFGHSLDDVYGLALSIVRLCGVARRAGQVVPWSLVLKIIAADRTPGDPSSPDSGERELMAYRSGLLESRSSFAAPRCFGVTERPAGDRWLWLEEITDDIGREWPPDRYRLAARHLGQFNASHLAGPATASCRWLSRSPLREAIRDTTPAIARLSGGLDNPLVAVAISPAAAAAILALLPKIDGWLDLLDRLPQALCHWDAHRANLFSRTAADGSIQTVAIDWAGLGWGPLGADLSKLLSQTVHFFGLDAGALPALEAALFDDYLEGLRASGWRGDRREIRLAYVTACAVRLIVRTATALRVVFDARARAAFERATGQSLAIMARGFGATLPYYLAIVGEADSLV